MQALAALCVRRPVFASVLILSLVVVGSVRADAAGRGPDAEHRHPDHHGHHAAARRGARAGGKRDHRQGRGSREHDQRHRPAELELGRRHLAGGRELPAGEGRRHRGAGSARPREPHPAAAAAHHHAADHREAGPRRAADLHAGADRRQTHPRRHRVRRQGAAAPARERRRRRARCWCSAAATARSTSSWTPSGCAATT